MLLKISSLQPQLNNLSLTSYPTCLVTTPALCHICFLLLDCWIWWSSNYSWATSCLSLFSPSLLLRLRTSLADPSPGQPTACCRLPISSWVRCLLLLWSVRSFYLTAPTCPSPDKASKGSSWSCIHSLSPPKFSVQLIFERLFQMGLGRRKRRRRRRKGGEEKDKRGKRGELGEEEEREERKMTIKPNI